MISLIKKLAIIGIVILLIAIVVVIVVVIIFFIIPSSSVNKINHQMVEPIQLSGNVGKMNNKKSIFKNNPIEKLSQSNKKEKTDYKIEKEENSLDIYKPLSGTIEKPFLIQYRNNLANAQVLKEKDFMFFFKNHLEKHLNAPLLHKRGNAFNTIFQHLEDKAKNKISQGINPHFTFIETGTTRKKIDPLYYENTSRKDLPIDFKDGGSTLLFDAFVDYYDGRVYSCDLVYDYCEISSSLVSKKTKVFCNDSVRYLNNLPKKVVKSADLIYLDSMDFDLKNYLNSALHHVYELMTLFKNLKPGTIVAIDDNPKYIPVPGRKNLGKGSFIKKFFIEHFGIQPWIDSYILAFIIE